MLRTPKPATMPPARMNTAKNREIKGIFFRTSPVTYPACFRHPSQLSRRNAGSAAGMGIRSIGSLCSILFTAPPYFRVSRRQWVDSKSDIFSARWPCSIPKLRLCNAIIVTMNTEIGFFILAQRPASPIPTCFWHASPHRTRKTRSPEGTGIRSTGSLARFVIMRFCRNFDTM